MGRSFSNLVFVNKPPVRVYEAQFGSGKIICQTHVSESTKWIHQIPPIWKSELKFMPPSLEKSNINNLLSASPNVRSARSGSRDNRRGIQKLQELKAVVEKAILNHKTFTVLGPFTCVKNALKLRGWIEKFENRIKYEELKIEKQAVQDFTWGTNETRNDTALNEFQISRLLRDNSVDFVWTMKNEPIKWKKLSSKTMVSRFPRAEFTTKAGLCSCLQQSYWYQEQDISTVLFPRCYNIFSDEELTAFIDNFRMTACISLIKFTYEVTKEENLIFDEDGTVPITSIEFAIQRCHEYISQQQHEDVDRKDSEKIWDHQWDQFLTYYYQVVHNGALFNSAEEQEIESIKEQCDTTLQEITEFWSQLHLDGINNLWILKPAAKSRGRGILILKNLEDILYKINSLQSKESRYVAQKYIERPLLIYETKFDIRQWFLVTCAFPLTIWMYKESYLRFCSQIFSLINTHESVHLSNNAVQCKYTNGKRDQNLPDENMWDCYTFQTYLRAKGQPEVWQTIIYPGMRQSIICTLLASQDTMDTRKNCFELFGADFMLSESFEPWLIEINSGPSMSSSTSVTARMCAQVLEDVIKVVIDRKYNKNADTGMFELVYRQNIPAAQPYMGQNLVVRGTKIETNRSNRGVDKKPAKSRRISNASTMPASKIFRAGSRSLRKAAKAADSHPAKKDARVVTTRRTGDNKENRRSSASEWLRTRYKRCENLCERIANLEAADKKADTGDPDKAESTNQFPFVAEKASKKPASPSSPKLCNGYDAFPRIT